MRWFLLSFFVLLSAACAQDVRDQPIAGLALNDMRVLEELGQTLTREERAALATYSIAHWPDAPGYCGEVLANKQGQTPQTIGEAITMTQAREAERAERLAAAALPKTPIDKLLAEKHQLTGQQEQLYIQMELLESAHGAAAQDLPAWTAVRSELDFGYARIARVNDAIAEFARQ
jgi:hypothetical protein